MTVQQGVPRIADSGLWFACLYLALLVGVVVVMLIMTYLLSLNREIRKRSITEQEKWIALHWSNRSIPELKAAWLVCEIFARHWGIHATQLRPDDDVTRLGGVAGGFIDDVGLDEALRELQSVTNIEPSRLAKCRAIKDFVMVLAAA